MGPICWTGTARLSECERLDVVLFREAGRGVKKIAFVTSSKGRLHHIRETLPLMVAQNPFEVIVVDYGCPDRTGDWVQANFPAAKVVRVDDDPAFCLPRARNLGARQASADWLVLIDGDVRAGEGWSAWMQQNLQPGNFYR